MENSVMITMTLDEAPRLRGGGMRYALLALLRRRLIWAVLALAGLLLFSGCARFEAQWHFDRGKADDKTGAYVLAEREYREAIRLRPDFAEAHLSLGLALWKELDKDGAINEIREAIRLKPDYAEAHFELGKYYGGYGKYYGEHVEDQIVELKKAVQLKPENVVWIEVLAQVLDLRERRKEARVYWEQAEKVEKRQGWLNRIKRRLAEPD